MKRFTKNGNFIERTYKDTWSVRNKALGDESYKDYLSSEHWTELKSLLRNDKKYNTCRFCESKSVELHHLTYSTIRTDKEKKKIIPVCRFHHQMIHDVSRLLNLSAAKATSFVTKRCRFLVLTENKIDLFKNHKELSKYLGK